MCFALLLPACLGREGGVQVDRVQKEFKPSLIGLPIEKFRAPQKNIIEVPFFKQGGSE